MFIVPYFLPPPNLYARQGVGAFENSLLSQGELSKDYEWIDLLLQISKEEVDSTKYIKDSDRNVINIAVYFERVWVNSQLNYKLESIHV